MYLHNIHVVWLLIGHTCTVHVVWILMGHTVHVHVVWILMGHTVHVQCSVWFMDGWSGCVI